MRERGFCSLAFPFGAECFAKLRSEALSKASEAFLLESEEPRVRKYVAPFGEAALSFASSIQLSDFIFEVFGSRLRLVEDRSGYMFFDEGCRLGKHKDTILGDVTATLIVYLAVRGANAAASDSRKVASELITFVANSTGLVIETIEGRMAVGCGNQVVHMRSTVPRDDLIVSMNMSFSDA